MTQKYCRGDIFFITDGVYIGSEQNAGRPGVIVSNNIGNKYSPNVEIVFLTTQKRNLCQPMLKYYVNIPQLLCVRIFKRYRKNDSIILFVLALQTK